MSQELAQYYTLLRPGGVLMGTGHVEGHVAVTRLVGDLSKAIGKRLGAGGWTTCPLLCFA